MKEDAPPPSPGDRTELQPEPSRAQARQLSTPKDVQQHPEAPKIPGYVLISPIGRGAYAQVWKAWQVRTHKWVAVKVFIQKTGVDWLFLQREVERLIRLDKHPHIVSLLDADLDGEPPYYVMDFMDGGSLEKHVDPGNPAPVDKAATWMDEICRALSYVHGKGLIHCDLKPANVLVDEEGHVRLADFGQSRIVTDSAGALGTLFYMAPEQAVLPKEGEPVQPDVRWDVYGLGATVWAILAGRVPHDDHENRRRIEAARTLEERLGTYREIARSRPLPELAAAAPTRPDPDLSAIVEMCVRAQPELRHAAARDVADDLAARREQRPVSALAGRKGYRLKKFILRNAALVAVASIAVSVITGTVVQIARERDSATRKLAFSYLVRAQQFAEKGDDASAAVYYAESNRLAPTHLAQANVLAHLNDLAVPLDILPHQSGVDVWAVAFSPDGKTMLTGSGDATARLWDVSTGEPVGKAMKHEKPVGAVAFSRDGKTVATGSWDATARLWDARTGEPVGQALRHEASVNSVAFSPDARTVVTGSWDKTARLWDARTGEPLGAPMGHAAEVEDVAFSPDGRTVLTAGSDATARLWDARTGEPVGRAMRHEGRVKAIAFSPDGKTVLTGSIDTTVRLWDAHTGSPTGKVMRHESPVYAVAFSPDGKIVLCGSGHDARLWDAHSGTAIGTTMRHEDLVDVVAFSPDGATVLTGSRDKTARLWSAHAGEPLGKAMRHEGAVRDAAFSPDGKAALTGSQDGLARLWDARARESIDRVMRHDGIVWAAAFSPDGKTVLTGSEDGTARLWDARTGAFASKSLQHAGTVCAVAFSPDGRTVLTGSEDKTARLWDAHAGTPVGKTMRHEGAVWSVAFSPDGSTALTGSEDKAALLWNAHTGAPLGAAMRHEHPVREAIFGPDGRTVLTRSSDKTARLWDARTGRSLGRAMRRGRPGILMQHAINGPWNGVAFSPDGDTILTSNLDDSASLWAARTGEPIGKIMRHEGTVWAAAFSPDGQTALTGSFDKTARLWDAHTGEPIGKIMRHEDWVSVSAVAFSPDGKTAVTGGFEHDARLWDARTGEPIGKIMRHPGAVTVIAFSPDGRTALTGGGSIARLWDTSWLNDPTAPDPRSVQVAAGRRITSSGDIERIPYNEWRELSSRCRRAARKARP